MKLLKANKSLSKRPKGQNMRSNKPERPRSQPSSRLKLQQGQLNLSARLQSTTHVIFVINVAYLDVRKIEYAEKIANVLS